MNNKSNKGFVSLTLVVTISSLLLAFSFMQSIEIGHFFDQTQNKIYRYMNYYNAKSCIDRAILNISHDYFFQTDVSIAVSDLHCEILMVAKENDLRLIKTRGNYKNIYVEKQAVIRLYDNRLEIISID